MVSSQPRPSVAAKNVGNGCRSTCDRTVLIDGSLRLERDRELISRRHHPRGEPAAVSRDTRRGAPATAGRVCTDPRDKPVPRSRLRRRFGRSGTGERREVDAALSDSDSARRRVTTGAALSEEVSAMAHAIARRLRTPLVRHRARSTTMPIRGVSLFVEVVGHGDPIVLMHGGPGADHWTMLPLRPLADQIHARLLRPSVQRALERRSAVVDDLGEPDGRRRRAAGGARVRAVGRARPLVRRPRGPRIRAPVPEQRVAPRPPRHRRRQPLGAGERAADPRRSAASAPGPSGSRAASSTGGSGHASSSRP